MPQHLRSYRIALVVAATVIPTLATAQQPAPAPQRPSWSAAVDSALGRPGAMNPGGVYKFGFPRSDLHVTVRGVALKPSLALGSWIAFRQSAAGHAMIMGDLVLRESEVPAVMRALQAGHVDQTALHNHVLGESPRVMYMHVAGTGDPAALARTIRSALVHTGTPLAAPKANAPAPLTGLDTSAIARVIGHAGKSAGGVYQISVPRPETIVDGADTIPPAMGTAIAINLQPTGPGRAATTGDFVLRASEVNPVIRALLSHGIDVTALHSHMLTEEPRLFFMHFWGEGDAGALAQGLRAALDATAARSP